MPWIFYDDYVQYLLGKECEAVFSRDQESITVTVYQTGENSTLDYRSYIVHTRSSLFRNRETNDYVRDIIWRDDYKPVMEYQYLVASENDSYIATVVKGQEITNLMALSSPKGCLIKCL